MLSGMEGFDPATLMKPFLPPHLQSMEALQKSFWDAFSAGMGQQSGKKAGGGEE
jgi:hypothetical protein